MKKVLSIVAVAGMFAITACGGQSAEDKAAAEKAKNDSIAAAEAQAAQAATEATPVDSTMAAPVDTAAAHTESH